MTYHDHYLFISALFQLQFFSMLIYKPAEGVLLRWFFSSISFWVGWPQTNLVRYTVIWDFYSWTPRFLLSNFYSSTIWSMCTQTDIFFNFYLLRKSTRHLIVWLVFFDEYQLHNGDEPKFSLRIITMIKVLFFDEHLLDQGDEPYSYTNLT